MRARPSKAQLRFLLALVAAGGEGFGLDMGARVVTVQACRAAGWVEYRPAATKFAIGVHVITAAGRWVAIDAAPAAYAARLRRASDTPSGQ